MKKYEVTVNGVVYEVSLRELEAGESVETTASQPSPEPVPSPTSPTGTTSGHEVKAPMAGNILKVSVAVGDEVKKGDELFVLEAMKMENPILASQDGVVQEILVSMSQTVESQQPLMIL